MQNEELRTSVGNAKEEKQSVCVCAQEPQHLRREGERINQSIHSGVNLGMLLDNINSLAQSLTISLRITHPLQ